MSSLHSSPKYLNASPYPSHSATKKITFSSIYRSPSSNAQDTQAFLTHLDSLLFNLSSNNHTSFICLDSNINILNSPCNLQYLSTINDNNFIQCIKRLLEFIIIPSHSSQCRIIIQQWCAHFRYQRSFSSFHRIAMKMSKKQNQNQP